MNNDSLDLDLGFKRPYYLRELKDRDLFTVLSIIDRIFPGDKLQKAFDEIATSGKTMEEIGIQVCTKLGFELIRNINAAHDEIYALLSDMSGLSIEMLDNMPFGTGPMMIWDIVNSAKNADFFKAVFKSE